MVGLGYTGVNITVDTSLEGGMRGSLCMLVLLGRFTSGKNSRRCVRASGSSESSACVVAVGHQFVGISCRLCPRRSVDGLGF